MLDICTIKCFFSRAVLLKKNAIFEGFDVPGGYKLFGPRVFSFSVGQKKTTFSSATLAIL